MPPLSRAWIGLLLAACGAPAPLPPSKGAPVVAPGPTPLAASAPSTSNAVTSQARAPSAPPAAPLFFPVVPAAALLVSPVAGLSDRVMVGAAFFLREERFASVSALACWREGAGGCGLPLVAVPDGLSLEPAFSGPVELVTADGLCTPTLGPVQLLVREGGCETAVLAVRALSGCAPSAPLAFPSQHVPALGWETATETAPETLGPKASPKDARHRALFDEWWSDNTPEVRPSRVERRAQRARAGRHGEAVEAFYSAAYVQPNRDDECAGYPLSARAIWLQSGETWTPALDGHYLRGALFDGKTLAYVLVDDGRALTLFHRETDTSFTEGQTREYLAEHDECPRSAGPSIEWESPCPP